MHLLWWFLPEEAFPIIVVGIGLLVMVGVIRLRTAILVIFALLLLPPLIGPLVEALFAGLSPWVGLLALALFGLVILRSIVALFIGRAAADTMVGTLAADMVRLAFRLAFLPFRLVGGGMRILGRMGPRGV